MAGALRGGASRRVHRRRRCAKARQALGRRGLPGRQSEALPSARFSPPDAALLLPPNQPLPRAPACHRPPSRLNAGETLRIVAIGSSSTTGLWVVTRAATYPEVMRRELARLWPSARIEVVNSGRIGET